MSNPERKLRKQVISGILVSATLLTGGIILADKKTNRGSFGNPTNSISTETPHPEPNPSPVKKLPEETPNPRSNISDIYPEILDSHPKITNYFESPSPISPPSL